MATDMFPPETEYPVALMKLVPVILPALSVSNPGAAEAPLRFNVPPFMVSPLVPKAAELVMQMDTDEQRDLLRGA
jgi:hypothetical protein